MSAPGPDNLQEGEEEVPPGASVMAALRWLLLALVGAAAAYTLILATHPSAPTAAREQVQDAGAVEHAEAADAGRADADDLALALEVVDHLPTRPACRRAHHDRARR